MEPALTPDRARARLTGWQRLVVAVLAGLGVTIVVVLVGTLVAVKLAPTYAMRATAGKRPRLTCRAAAESPPRAIPPAPAAGVA